MVPTGHWARVLIDVLIVSRLSMSGHFEILIPDFSVHQLVQILVLWSQGSELLVVLRRASLWQGPGATFLQISKIC